MLQNVNLTRRDALAITAAAAATTPAAAALPPGIDPALVRRNDEAVASYLQTQNMAPNSRHFGGVPDSTELWGAGGASGLTATLAAAFVHPDSKHHRSPELLRRVQAAGKFLESCQSPDGNIDLLSTNFNSPPDTGFIVHNVATAASVARKQNAPEIEKALEPFLKKAGAGMTKGGIHTPNHRWVVSSALAQLHELWPNPAYTRRIDQWLAEGIDIDEDGQFTERSTVIYNTVCDAAFTRLAIKLKRPDLLDPVRRNLDAMLYYLHADGEVVTEISRRQDLNERGTMDRYWLPLRALAVLDKNGQFANLTRRVEPKAGSLASLLDMPEIAGAMPPDAPLPEDFRKVFPAVRLVRYRRGPTSASILLDGTSRFFSVRHGDVVIDAVRFATSFFGKGQFIPTEGRAAGEGFRLTQNLEAGYYQPLDPPEKLGTGDWRNARSKRKVTELCRLEQSADIQEIRGGFRLALKAHGTPNVPLTVEIGAREGSTIETKGPGESIIRRGRSMARITHGPGEHKYFNVRGAEAPLPGPKLYVTGYTPFERTVEIRFE